MLEIITIEGIGDEVVLVFVACVVLIIASIVFWCSRYNKVIKFKNK